MGNATEGGVPAFHRTPGEASLNDGLRAKTWGGKEISESYGESQNIILGRATANAKPWERKVLGKAEVSDWQKGWRWGQRGRGSGEAGASSAIIRTCAFIWDGKPLENSTQEWESDLHYVQSSLADDILKIHYAFGGRHRKPVRGEKSRWLGLMIGAVKVAGFCWWLGCGLWEEEQSEASKVTGGWRCHHC